MPTEVEWVKMKLEIWCLALGK